MAISKLLADARNALLSDQQELAMCRRMGIFSNRDERLLREAEQNVLSSLDRVWLVQAMFDPLL